MKLHEILAQKRQWRAHVRRIKALPRDYQIVYEQMQNYLFKVGPEPFEASLELLSGIAGLFTEGAAAGKDVLAVTGRDVASFCDGLIADVPTQLNRTQETVSRETAKALEKASRKIAQEKH